MPKRSSGSEIRRAADPAAKMRFQTCSLGARELWRELNSKFRLAPGTGIDLHPTRFARLLGADVGDVVAAAADLLGSGLVRGSVSSERIELNWGQDEGEDSKSEGAQAPQGATGELTGPGVPRPATPAPVSTDAGDPSPRPPQGVGAGARTRRRASKRKDKKNKKKNLSSSSSPSSSSASSASTASSVASDATNIGAATGPTWSREGGWRGIDDEDLRGWKHAFPDLDVDRELAQMNAWCRANPAKTRRNDWARFIVNWLKRGVGSGHKSSLPPGAAPRPAATPGSLIAPSEVRRAAERAGELPEPNLLSRIVIGGPTGLANTLQGATHEQASAA